MSLPIVGARISLISKSDIRYVGILHSINHEESSVSLEQVVSYGTEGRIGLPDKEIPPQNQIFPLIVFKGTDVKDLKVEENLVAPPPNNSSQWGGYQQFNPYFNPYQQVPQMQQQGMYWQQQQPSNVAAPSISGGAPGFGSVVGGSQAYTQSGTFSNFSMPSSVISNPFGSAATAPISTSSFSQFQQPSRGAPVRVERPPQSQQVQPPVKQSLHKPVRPEDPTVSSLPPVDAAIAFGKGTTVTPTDTPRTASQNPWKTTTNSTRPASSSQPQQQQPLIKEEKKNPQPAVKSALKLNTDPVPDSSTKKSSPNNDASSATTPTSAIKNISLKDIRRPGAVNGNANEVEQNARPASTERSRNYRGNNQRRHHPKMVIPTEEFDFEQSNAKFDRTEEGGNDDDDDDDDDDSHSDDEASRKPTSAFYQKSSFFDDISSESKERNAAREQPFDRRAKMAQERQTNMETFGQSGIRRGGRGRGRGGRGRGGNHGNRKTPVENAP